MQYINVITLDLDYFTRKLLLITKSYRETQAPASNKSVKNDCSYGTSVLSITEKWENGKGHVKHIMTPRISTSEFYAFVRTTPASQFSW